MEASLPILDSRVVAELRSLGGPEFFAELLTAFDSTVREHLRRSTEALAAGEVDTIRRSAHGLRSSLGNVGALRMMALATRIEEEALALSPAELEAQLAALQAEYAAVCRELERTDS